MPITSYRDLDVYRRAMNILVDVHRMTAGFPAFEQRELGSQIRRASKSVPIDIAEGYGRRKSEKDFKSFLATAMGSANEMVVCLEISKLLGYAREQDCDTLIREYEEVGKMLNGLITNWRQF